MTSTANRRLPNRPSMTNGSEGYRLVESHLPEERAVAIGYNGLNHVVMMASPEHLEDFVVGFSLNEGIVQSINDIRDIHVLKRDTGVEVDIEISPRAFHALKKVRRNLQGFSGCGLCGHDSLEHALPTLLPLNAAPLPPATHLDGLRDLMRTHQTLGASSGGLHAALLMDNQGKPMLCREDIGRHNALDKVIGAAQRQSLVLSQSVVIMTSRCSVELIQKAVRAGLPTLVSFSPPSTLARQLANKYRLNLVQATRHDGLLLHNRAMNNG